MHILLTTYGLLLIFTLFCAAQWRSATDMVFLDTAAIDTFTNARKKMLDVLNNRAKTLYKNNSPEEPQKNPRSSKAVSSTINSQEPAADTALIEEDDDEDETIIEEPEESDENQTKKNTKSEKCSQYLYIGEMFTGENPNITEKKGKACYRLLKNLISNLYEGQEFFEEAREKVSELEDQFIMTLFEKAKEAQTEKQWIKSVKMLDKLKLDDEIMTHMRYKTFTGNKSRYEEDSTNQAGYFPLTEMLSLSSRDKIMSLWLAPKPLLMALFQNPDIVEEVLQVRAEIYKEVKKDRSLLATKEKDLHMRYHSSIDLELVEFINFKVSTTPPPDMPKTQKKSKS